MKLLAIAEKPSTTRDTARILKCGKNIDNAIEGECYMITWGLGHLVTPADPEDYDKKYKERKTEDPLIMPGVFEIEVAKQTSKQYQAVKDQICRGGVGDIIIATDAGREGELVARLILKRTGCNRPIRCLWISSMTGKIIKEGSINLKDEREYSNLYDAAMCRVEADWLIDINATRALTCRYNAQLPCDRAQASTLAIIAKREVQVRASMPQPYLKLQAGEDRLVLIWQDARTGSRRSFERGRTKELAEDPKGESAVVTEVKRTLKETLPPLLYDLTELQRDANRQFNYSVKGTLNTMQNLYESRKTLTYPKADSRYLSADIVPALRKHLKARSIGPYKTLAGRLVNQPLPSKPFFVGNSKVSDHRVIVPTEQSVQMDHMTIDEHRIYDLVVCRFLVVPHPPFEYGEISLEADIGGQCFIAKGRIVRGRGWKVAYDTTVDDEEEGKEGDEPEVKDQQLLDLREGDVLESLFIKMTEGKTRPPAPFNEITLLPAVESPVAYMGTKNKVMTKTLGETGGLGAVTTRIDIIEKLSSGFLFERRGRDAYLTSKVRQLLELVPGDLKKPELTTDWEMKLSDVVRGGLKRGVFMKDVRGYSQELIRQVKTGGSSFHHDNLTNTKCPVCGKRMSAVKGKNTEILVCQDRECGHREVVSRTPNARCPVCHKKMELKGKGGAQIFICRYGHEEKLKAFQKRRKREGTGVLRKDVARYPDQQEKEAGEPVDNAFAKMLAGISLKDEG